MKNCLKCNKKLHYKNKSGLCGSCSQKNRFKTPQDNPRYIDGRRSKDYYCSCGKTVSYISILRKKDKAKCASCAKLGSNNSFYKKIHTRKSRRLNSLSHGGTGIPYEKIGYGIAFTKGLKEQIRFRDCYKCKLCGCSQLENNGSLDVHHIDYNKQNNDCNNLIALCKGCHMKTNYNRKYWTEIFKTSGRACHIKCHDGTLKLENVRK